METRFINSFLTVAELKSFTRAAEEMHFSQSTVSNQIKQLEIELGYPLFDRIGNKVDLTPAGLLFSRSLCRYTQIHKSIKHSFPPK